MPVKRKRRRSSDNLYVTTTTGLPLGHLDLRTRQRHDVPVAWAEAFRAEVDAWLTEHGMPVLGASAIDAPPPMLEAGATEDPGSTGRVPATVTHDEDLATHRAVHGLVDTASRARAESGRGADRPHLLRADGRQAVAAALAKLMAPTTSLRRGRGPRWHMLHGVTMALDDEDVLLDHVVVGPPGVFLVEVLPHPGGMVHIGTDSLEVAEHRIDLDRRRILAEEAELRLSEALALEAGAEETLNPPPVSPVIAVVGGTVGGGERPRGVLVSRVGHLPRLLQAFGRRLSDEAVDQTYAVARRGETWTR